MTDPNGCRHCGAAQYGHAQRWTDEAGWHTHTEPTDAQRLARMRARRTRRTAAAPTHPTDTKPEETR